MAMNPTDIRVTTYSETCTPAGGMRTGLVQSGITALHMPSGIGVTVDSERSQYANKQKALQLLESLLIAIESEKHLSSYNTDAALQSWQLPPPTPYVADKVRMIKEVRQLAGCGLKEAKEAVDKMGSVSAALNYLNGSTGYCKEGFDKCVCGGDLPAIREGCYNWQK